MAGAEEGSVRHVFGYVLGACSAGQPSSSSPVLRSGLVGFLFASVFSAHFARLLHICSCSPLLRQPLVAPPSADPAHAPPPFCPCSPEVQLLTLAPLLTACLPLFVTLLIAAQKYSDYYFHYESQVTSSGHLDVQLVSWDRQRGREKGGGECLSSSTSHLPLVGVCRVWQD